MYMFLRNARTLLFKPSFPLVEKAYIQTIFTDKKDFIPLWIPPTFGAVKKIEKRTWQKE